MIKVNLFIYNEAVPTAVAAIIDLFESANQYLEAHSGSRLLDVKLISEYSKQVGLTGRMSVRCHESIRNARTPNLIIIPPFHNLGKVPPKYNAVMIDWIKNMHALGTEVAGICTGSFFLSEAGLLNGKTVASYTQMSSMQNYYPNVAANGKKIFTVQDGIYTSGEGFSSLKLILYLIQKYCGRQTAVAISKQYTLTFDLDNEHDFSNLTLHKLHGDKEIQIVQDYIEKNFAEQISLELLAGMTTSGIRNFLRKFKAATNNTPIEYLQRVRIEIAKKELEEPDRPLIDVLQKIGYRDMKNFRSVFKRLTGLSPHNYRKEYGRPFSSI